MEDFADFYYEQNDILVMRIRPIDPTDAQVRAYTKRIVEELNAAKNSLILINDASDAKVLKPEHRIEIGNILKKEKQLFQQKVLGLIYVIPHPVLQFVLNGIFLISRPPVDYKVVSRLPKAISWAEKKLERASAKAC